MSFRIKPKFGGGKAVLAFSLFHGDMVVMHGSEIHKYYDVSFLFLQLHHSVKIPN
jgi:alkylated DNA repair dioxygenase AlkB